MTSVPNPDLDTGLAAIKEGNYSLAIAHLEAVCEIELDESIVSRALIGLVTAYRSIGNGEKAIALCQQLHQDPNPKIQQWANNTLTELSAEYPPSSHPASSEPTGFVPLAQTPTPPQATRVTSTPNITRDRGAGGAGGAGGARGARGAGGAGVAGVAGVAGGAEEEKIKADPSSIDRTLKNSPTNTSQLPIPYSPPSTPSLFTPRPRFRNLGRAKTWNPLKPPKLTRLWLGEIGTAIALFFLLRFWVQFLIGTTNTILGYLPLVQPLPLFYRDPTPTIWVILLLSLLLCPWLIDALLKQFYGLEKLSITQLASRSPEAAKVVQRFCRQRRLPLPNLGILPTPAPVAMTYGNLPRTARIVVSEGLLTQLADDEIATIYAGELGHICHWDFMIMSIGTLLSQIPYTIYWQVAQAGEWLAQLITDKLPAYRQFLPSICYAITGGIATISYASYWILRLPLVWLAKVRFYYSDRIAIETTGNPNGLTRALLKIALGITEDIQTSNQTSGLLESYDLLLPIGYQQAIPFSSCSPQTSFEAILNWDCTNPYRDWLIITASHPRIGDRLHLCARYAHHWTLGTELDLPIPTPPVRDNTTRLLKLKNSYQALPLLQSSILAAIILGILLRIILWLIGIISDLLSAQVFTPLWRLIWLHNANPFLNACILSAFSLSIVIWLNSYFPDIKPPTVNTQPNLGELFANPNSLPPAGPPVQLSGKLLGRSRLLNWLGQDLILQTSTGLVKLHFLSYGDGISYLGRMVNLLPEQTNPGNLVGKQVTIKGWFRRGVTPWIDLDSLRSTEGKISHANYPILFLIVAFIAALRAAYIIWNLPA